MPKARQLTLEQMVKAYTDDLGVRNYKPKTILGYAKNLRTFANWAVTQGRASVADLDVELVKAYIRYLQHKPKWSERGYKTSCSELVSASAIRNYIRDLKTFATWLAAEGYTGGDVLAGVRQAQGGRGAGCALQGRRARRDLRLARHGGCV